jgi:hypothetical protein
MQPTHSLRRKLATGALVTSLSFAAIAMPLTSARAHEGEDHGAHSHAAGEYKTPAEAWKAAQTSVTHIASFAAAKNLKPIHDEQAKLDAALNYIQANSTGAADKARLDGAIKNATAASGKVHEAADAGDQAKVDSSVKTLQATMTLVEKQLPAGAK